MQYLPKIPGKTHEKYIMGSFLLCQRAVREADTNAISIFGIFNKLSINMHYIGNIEAIPFVEGHIYFRLQTEGPRKIDWAIYIRTLEWAGIAEEDTDFKLFATGDLEIKPENNATADSWIPKIGNFFALTPKRRESFQPGKPLSIKTQYALYCDGEFVVAHTVDFIYTLTEEAPPNGQSPEQSTGTP